MIDISNWKFGDLERFVADNQTEDSHLDFKGSPAVGDWEYKQRFDMSKDVSSFANAAGGILIYGAVESKSHGSESVPKFERFDDGFSSAITRESIEDVLTSEKYIHKKIDGLKIQPIEVPNSKGQRIYLVIGVPSSYRAPHMHNPTKHYYKRHNFKAEPMEGYEVEDIRNRVMVPQVRLTYPCKIERIVGQGEVHYNVADFCLENIGARSLKNFRFELRIPAVIEPECAASLSKGPQEEINEVDYKFFHADFSVPDKILFPGQQLLLAQLKFKIDHSIYSYLEEYNPKFYWRIYKDDAPPDFGEEFVREMHNF